MKILYDGFHIQARTKGLRTQNGRQNRQIQRIKRCSSRNNFIGQGSRRMKDGVSKDTIILRMVGEEPESLIKIDPQHFLRGSAEGFGSPGESLGQRGKADFHTQQIQRILIFKVMIDNALGYPTFREDRAERSTFISLLGEILHGRIQNPLPG